MIALLWAAEVYGLLAAIASVLYVMAGMNLADRRGA